MFFDTLIEKYPIVFTRDEGEFSVPVNFSLEDFQLFYVREDTHSFLPPDEITKNMEKNAFQMKGEDKGITAIGAQCMGYIPYDFLAIEFVNGLYLMTAKYQDSDHERSFYRSDQCKWTDGSRKVQRIDVTYINKGGDFIKTLQGVMDGSIVTDRKFVEAVSYMIETDSMRAVFCGVTPKRAMADALEDRKTQIMYQGLRTTFIVSKFINFLSCKNVRTKDIASSSTLNRSRAKKGKKPMVSYKILQLRPVGSGRKGEAKGAAMWENRIHLCRGHFKEFTEEKPLMGKHVGRYWWQPFARGRDKNGIVLKDYEMKTPKA